MAEPDPPTNMVAFIRTTASKKCVEIPYARTVTIGRSHKADLQIMGNGVSSNHVEIKLIEGRNVGTVTVKDVSQNGTGFLRPRQQAHEVIPLPCDSEMIVPWGCGLIVPMRKPGAAKSEPQTLENVIWVELAKPQLRDGHPEFRGRRQISRPRPTTWPSSWPSLPQDVQDVWRHEGIEDVMDLQTFYTSVQELHDHLGKNGIFPAHYESRSPLD